MRHYLQVHGARVTEFLPLLMGVEDRGVVVGAIGLREGGQCEGGGQRDPLFLEAYLAEPAESLLSAALGRTVRRQDIAEIGNLASATPGGGRLLTAAFAAYLAEVGLDWAMFTATLPLRNGFARQGVPLIDLGPADGACLGSDVADWGRYYEADPRVTAVSIADVAAVTHTNPRLADCIEHLRGSARRAGVVRRASELAA